MQWHRAIGLAIGLVLLCVLIWVVDWRVLLHASERLGWPVVASVCAWHALPLWLDAHAWRRVSSVELRPLDALVWRWYSESVNALLPVAQVGGDVLRARAWSRTGVALSTSAVIVSLDVVAAAVAQLPFTLLGVAALADFDALSLLVVCVGLLFGLVGPRSFVCCRDVALTVGQCLQACFARRVWMQSLRVHGLNLSLKARAAWRQSSPGQWRESLIWHGLGWCAGVGEIWLGLHMLGVPVSLTEALVLESMLQTARSLAFFVPSALGVQEAAIVAAGLALGIDLHSLLSMALLKRARELCLGAPGIALWLAAEWRYQRANPRSC